MKQDTMYMKGYDDKTIAGTTSQRERLKIKKTTYYIYYILYNTIIK